MAEYPELLPWNDEHGNLVPEAAQAEVDRFSFDPKTGRLNLAAPSTIAEQVRDRQEEAAQSPQEFYADFTADDLDASIGRAACVLPLTAAEIKDNLLVMTDWDRDSQVLGTALGYYMTQLTKGEQTVMLTDVSAEDRRRLAARGHALPDGSYPVADKQHLFSAAKLAASGHGDYKAARKLIIRRARELGVPLDSLPGFQHAGVKKAKKKPHDNGTDGADSFSSGGGEAGGPSGDGGGSGMSMAAGGLTWEQPEYDSLDDIVERNRDIPCLALAARSASVLSDAPFEVHDVGTVQDNADDEIARFGEMLKQATRSGRWRNQDIGADKPSGSVNSYGPKKYVPPGPSGRPQTGY